MKSFFHNPLIREIRFNPFDSISLAILHFAILSHYKLRVELGAERSWILHFYVGADPECQLKKKFGAGV